MSALAAACPSFADAWAQQRVEWPDSGGPHAYIDVSRFAVHLVDQLEADEVDEFPATFGAVEVLLSDADPGVRCLVKIGLLEDIGNGASNRHGWPWAARFRKWFGPLTFQAWDELHVMWGTSDDG